MSSVGRRRHRHMGRLAADPVEHSEHDHAPWEKEVDVILPPPSPPVAA
ncbi:hypothetical protein [Marinimicrococcus flavescens]|uniref:Uncharacterized protein n=1 Tax=Marinimicrococcus flavescens TaxID=3031815 RepID=A0AAP3XQQ8_9PROT|nr:hypothetical protein [Marinimicrococcus flavescens]